MQRILQPVLCNKLAKHTASKKLLISDKYEETPCANDHERVRKGRASEIMLTSSTILPCRDVILHNASNKNKLISILCEDSVTNNIQLINKQNCSVSHCEADITLCSYILKAVEDGAETIRILSDDTDICVLLVFWVGTNINNNIEMEKWNGDILDIKKTVYQLGPRKCSQLLGMYALLGVILCHIQ